MAALTVALLPARTAQWDVAVGIAVFMGSRDMPSRGPAKRPVAA